MADRNWDMISSGETFQGLVSALIIFDKDPKAFPFDRPGKDGGQDILSGDGSTVYQAKFHKVPTTAKVLQDARNEIAKIAEYKKHDHARYNQWKGVNNWILVTNAEFNPTDLEKWTTEIIPLFSSHGLTSTYWNRAILNHLLNKYPTVDRSYFQNETRVFLSLPEAEEQFIKDSPFLPRAGIAKLQGRDAELKKIDNFLSFDKKFLVVHGAGGIGKTRLLIEAGWRNAATWQILWANKASMEQSSNWFVAIDPERQTLLLIDEPESERLLQQLKEQVNAYREMWDPKSAAKGSAWNLKS